jgi:acetyl esterase/lipase
MLDVYMPENAEQRENKGEEVLPVVIHIHGGGWVRGDRKDVFRGAPSFGIAYAQMGCVAVCVSYRLSDAPHTLDDCKVRDAKHTST